MWSARAEAGDASAQFQLGACLEMGIGATTDLETAVKWYRRAAAQGHARAQYHLGLTHSYGSPGADWDLAEACKWLTLASRAGIEEARQALRELRASSQQRMLGERMAREFAAKTEPQRISEAPREPSEEPKRDAVQLGFPGLF